MVATLPLSSIDASASAPRAARSSVSQAATSTEARSVPVGAGVRRLRLGTERAPLRPFRVFEAEILEDVEPAVPEGAAASLQQDLVAASQDEARLASREAVDEAWAGYLPTISGSSDGGYNILFILTDQERYFRKGELPEGYRLPGHERLARKGVVFDNHRINSCVCTPSRSVLYTGRHVQQTKMFDNTNFPWISSMSTEIPTIGHMMRDAGYNIPRSAGLIAAGGVIAPVIPPSIGFGELLVRRLTQARKSVFQKLG